MRVLRYDLAAYNRRVPMSAGWWVLVIWLALVVICEIGERRG